MGVLSWLKFWEKRSNRIDDPRFWVNDLNFGLTKSGTSISADSAMRISTVYACTSLLSAVLASLPLQLFKWRKSGGQDPAEDHYLYPMFHYLPNGEQTSYEFREMLQGHLCLRGNGYVYKEIGGDGRVKNAIPLNPSRMNVTRENGEIWYNYSVNNDQDILSGKLPKIYRFPSDVIWHIKGISTDGLMGLSPITMARESMGLAKAAEEFGAEYFGNKPIPGGIASHQKILSEPARDRLEKALQRFSTEKRHKVMVLEEGMTWQQVGLSNEDSQFLECCAPGTMFAMADGTRRPVESLIAGDLIIGWNDGPVISKIATVGKPHVKPLVRVTTARGRTLVASADHPFLGRKRFRTPGSRVDTSPDKFIPAGDLAIGDYVRVGLAQKKCVPIRTEAAMDFDTAWFLGAMVGDGYIRQKAQSFACADDGVLAKMKLSVKGLGGTVKATPKPIDWDVLTNTVGRKGSQIRNLLKAANLVSCGSLKKRVPDIVMRGGPIAWAGFLSGYFDTDGSIRDPQRKQKPALYWSSINRPLLDDCQHLLSLLGINSAIYKMYNGGKRLVCGQECEAHPGWGLYVMGVSELKELADILVLSHTEKAERLAKCKKFGQSRYRSVNFEYDRIIKVEQLGDGKTIGVEVADVHTHITNGLVTHNTRSFQVEDVCRFFNVPPYLVHHQRDKASTFASAEQLSLNFVVFSFMAPWVTRWEQSLAKSFLTDRERSKYFFKFNLNALQRGDYKSRMEGYAKGRQWGIFSANDCRSLEDMNPREGGDQYIDNPQNITGKAQPTNNQSQQGGANNGSNGPQQ